MTKKNQLIDITKRLSKSALTITKDATETTYFLIKSYEKDKKAEKYNQNISDYKKYLKEKNEYGTPRKAIDGTVTKSDAEAKLYHWFILNDIKCEYEYETIKKRFWESGYKREFKPDFYLPEYDIIVEYLGLTGKYNYDKNTSEKMEYYKKRKLKAIFIFPEELQNTKDVFLREYKVATGFDFPKEIMVDSTEHILESKKFIDDSGYIESGDSYSITLLMNRKEKISINYISTEILEVGIQPSEAMIKRLKKVKMPQSFKGYRTGIYYTFETTAGGLWEIYAKNISSKEAEISISIRRDDY